MRSRFLLVFAATSVTISIAPDSMRAQGASAAGSPAAAPAPIPDSAIRSILQKSVGARQTAGIVVGLSEKGKSRFISAGSFNGPGTPAVDENTLFEIGSITKVFTGTLLAMAVEKGEVKLDDPVSKYLPDSVRVPSRNGKLITLLDLATQTSGLPRMPSNFQPADNLNPFADYDARRMYAFLSGHTLARDPGQQYEYSNLGMGLLGFVLARRAGMSYEALVTKRILEPLGMRDTRITLTPALAPRFAAGHTATLEPQKPWDFDALAGAGALRSTARDMLRFIVASMQPAHTPLAAAAPLAQESRRPSGSPGLSLGLAWHIIDRNGQRYVWHNGQTGGFHSFTGFNAATGSAVIVLSNSPSNIDDIGMHLLDPSVPIQEPVAATVHTEIKVDPATLDRFVGEYQAAPGFSLVITKESNSLWAQATGQSKFPIYAEAPERFFFKVVDATLTFGMDSSGTVTVLTLTQGGQKIPAKKIH